MFDISASTLKTAAQQKYGEAVQVSEPYWADDQAVRVGIALGDMSFGANFYYKTGVFS